MTNRICRQGVVLSSVIWLATCSYGVAGEVRAWTNASGTQTIEAEFLDLKDGRVRLRRKDTGKEISMPLEKLSAADQQYVQQLPKESIVAPVEETKPAEDPSPVPPPKVGPREDSNKPADGGKPAKQSKKVKKAKSPDVRKEQFVLTKDGVPMANLLEFHKRAGMPVSPTLNTKAKSIGAGEGKQHEWQVYVPAQYTPDTPHGLFIYIDSGAGGRHAGDWAPVFDKHKLIMVSPANAANENPVPVRILLGLSGAQYIEEEYAIDPKRVYISGTSGGGKVASRMAVYFPDIFTGAFYHCGCDYWRSMPAGEGKFMPGFWPNPNAKLLAAARKNRFVFLTGSKDHNMEPTRAVFTAYRNEGFANTMYLEVPEMGHDLPNAEWFEKGIEALDTPASKRKK
ncbi:MAG: prolyl oligopeptidase family serine peptidase [Planctomycetes bacterium]|nr:prolyl oligopeptidase family serine peptidase [Planctomycetota bacterium]